MGAIPSTPKIPLPHWQDTLGRLQEAVPDFTVLTREHDGALTVQCTTAHVRTHWARPSRHLSTSPDPAKQRCQAPKKSHQQQHDALVEFSSSELSTHTITPSSSPQAPRPATIASTSPPQAPLPATITPSSPRQASLPLPLSATETLSIERSVSAEQHVSALHLRGWAPPTPQHIEPSLLQASECSTADTHACSACVQRLFQASAAKAAEVEALCEPVPDAFSVVQTLQGGRYHGFQHIFKHIRSWRDVGFEALPGAEDMDVPCGTLRGHRAGLSLVVWSPDGVTLATGSKDGTIRLWNTALHEQMHVLNALNKLPTWANQRPPNKYEYTVNSLEDQQPAKEPPAQVVNALAWSHDGGTITTQAGTSHRAGVVCVKRWKFTGEPLPELTGPMRRQTSSACSPDGRILATKSDDGTVRLWAQGRLLRELHGHTELVRSLAWRPDGQCLATGGRDVQVWDVETGTVMYVLRGHTHWVCCLSFSPGGSTLASGSLDDTVRLWDSVTGACVQVLYGHTGPVNSVAWSPDGGIVATASEDCTARLWYPATRERRLMPAAHSSVWYCEPVITDDTSSEDFDWGS